MPRIIWEGNRDWDTKYPEQPLPPGAHEISLPKNIFTASLVYALPPVVVCAAALAAKAFMSGGFPIAQMYLPVGILLGLLLMPVHELLHAVCCPKNSTAHVGVCLKKAAAFCVCHYPMTRRRFVFMSILPVVLGVVPLVLFAAFPPTWKIPSAICWAAAVMGLIAPSPDYMDIRAVLSQTPCGALIQTSNGGMFWTLPADGGGEAL